MTAPTYHPIIRWACSHCRTSGEVTCNVSDAADARYNKVLDAHLDAAEECWPQHGDSGITVKEEAGDLPE